MDVFYRQSEAREYVSAVDDSTERLLLELMLNRTISFLLGDEQYRIELPGKTFDLLTFVRATHASIKAHDVLGEVLTGQYRTLDEITEKLGFF